VTARADVRRGPAKALRVAAGEDHVGALGAGQSCRFESDAGTAADEDEVWPSRAGSRMVVELSVTVLMTAPMSERLA
jgi:hypothetical protein